MTEINCTYISRLSLMAFANSSNKSDILSIDAKQFESKSTYNFDDVTVTQKGYITDWLLTNHG